MRSNTLCRAPFLWQWFQMCGRKCHSKKKQVIQNVAFRTLCLCCFYIVKSFYLTPNPCLVLSFVFFVLVLSFGKNLPLKCLELYLNYWFAHEGMYCKILIWGGGQGSLSPLSCSACEFDVFEKQMYQSSCKSIYTVYFSGTVLWFSTLFFYFTQLQTDLITCTRSSGLVWRTRGNKWDSLRRVDAICTTPLWFSFGFTWSFTGDWGVIKRFHQVLFPLFLKCIFTTICQLHLFDFWSILIKRLWVFKVDLFVLFYCSSSWLIMGINPAQLDLSFT